MPYNYNLSHVVTKLPGDVVLSPRPDGKKSEAANAKKAIEDRTAKDDGHNMSCVGASIYWIWRSRTHNILCVSDSDALLADCRLLNGQNS